MQATFVLPWLWIKTDVKKEKGKELLAEILQQHSIQINRRHIFCLF